MEFDWDPKKAEINFKKHGITFGEARWVFKDNLALYEQDKSYPERMNIIGIAAGHRVLFVVHIEIEDDDLVRIISARRATKAEIRRYENG